MQDLTAIYQRIQDSDTQCGINNEFIRSVLYEVTVSEYN